MALKSVVDSLDGLSDAVKAEYTDAGDGTFRLNVENADALVDTSGLKKTVKRLREENATLGAWAKAFPDKTPDEIAEMVKHAEGRGDGAPDVEKLRTKWQADEEKKTKPIIDERDALKRENRELKMSGVLRKAAAAAGVFEDRIEDALRLTDGRFDLDEKGKVIVLDEDGEPSSKTVEQYFSETLKESKPYLFKAPDASGSGGGGRRPNNSQQTSVKSKKDLKTDDEKVAFISKNGRQAYFDLPAE